MICLLLKQLLKISNLITAPCIVPTVQYRERLEFVCRHVLTIPLSLLLLFVRRKEEGKRDGVGKKAGKNVVLQHKVWCREISKEK